MTIRQPFHRHVRNENVKPNKNFFNLFGGPARCQRIRGLTISITGCSEHHLILSTTLILKRPSVLEYSRVLQTTIIIKKFNNPSTL